jgi:hypothetical protein
MLTNTILYCRSTKTIIDYPLTAADPTLSAAGLVPDVPGTNVTLKVSKSPPFELVTPGLGRLPVYMLLLGVTPVGEVLVESKRLVNWAPIERSLSSVTVAPPG